MQKAKPYLVLLQFTFGMNYRNVLLGTVTATHFANDGLDMILPVILPILVEKFSLSFFQMGLVITSYFLSASLLQPLLGYASDVTGGKKIYLCGGLLILAISLYLIQFASNFIFTAVIAFIAGVGYSIYHPEGMAFIGYFFKKRRGLGMGIHGLGGSAGRAFFPLITATFVSLYGLGPSLFFVLLIGLGVSLFAFWTLKEISTPIDKKFPLKQIGWIVILVTIIHALGSAFFYGTISFVPTFFVNVLNADIIWSGLSIFIMTLAGLITQPVGGYLSDHVGRRKVLAISSFGSGMGFFVFLMLSPPISLIALASTGFFMFLGFPMPATIISDIIPKEALSTNIGIVSGIGGIGAVISPIIVGKFADQIGLHQALFVPILFIILSGVLTLLLPENKNNY